MSQPVKFSADSGVATITLNRPDRLNALTRPLLLDLRGALHRAAEDTSVRAVCLAGAGRGFCAGQDLSERDPRHHSHPFDLEALQKELFHPVVRLMTEMEKPVVAKINGIAAGAGASLALSADFVIATRSARFAFSFARVGLSVDAGAGWFLTRALGPARARALLMLGDTLGAGDAAAVGLIHRAVEDTALTPETDALLQRLVQAPRSALSAIKQAVHAANTSPDLPAYLLKEASLQGDAGLDPDYAEGVLAFLEKRSPDFR